MDRLFDVAAWEDFFAAFPWLWPLGAAFVGAVLASFGGVVVDRLPASSGWDRDLPERESRQMRLPGIPPEALDLSTPSRCPCCGTRLNALALAPVLGWLAYRGRCFACGAQVPGRYPAVEAASALASAAFARHLGVTAQGAWALCALWACVVVAWMDLREQWLMDRLTVPLILAGLLASPFQPLLVWRVEGMAACVGVFWVCFALLGWMRGEDLMMGGDFMMAAAGGAWLGLPGLPAFLMLTAAAFALYTIPQRRRGVLWAPLGPAMCAGLLACLWLGPASFMPLG